MVSICFVFGARQPHYNYKPQQYRLIARVLLWIRDIRAPSVHY